jgi:LysM repeat protein
VTSLNGFIGALPVTDAPPPAATGLQTNIANAYVLNVRSGPGPDFPEVRRVTLGDQVTLIARNADGSWVQLASSVSEWINSYYTTISGSGAILGLPIVAYTTNPAPGPVPSVPTSPTVHVVQPGETLFSIATRYGTNVYTLAAANGITNVNYIYAGQRIVIP